MALSITLISMLLFTSCNGYLEFLTTNSVAIAPDMSQMDTIGTGEFTVSVWFNAEYSDDSASTVFVSTRSPGQPTTVCNSAISSILVGFYPNWGGFTPFRPFIQLGCNYLSYNAPQLYTDGNWHHLVIAREESASQYTLNYYVDTVNVHSVGPTSSANLGTNIKSLATAKGIWIGDDYVSTGYIGKLAHLSFWSRALDIDEIVTIYEKTECQRMTRNDIKFDGLLHYYPLDEDTDECAENGVVFDIHNGNDAVLSSITDPICVDTCITTEKPTERPTEKPTEKPAERPTEEPSVAPTRNECCDISFEEYMDTCYCSTDDVDAESSLRNDERGIGDMNVGNGYDIENPKENAGESMVVCFDAKQLYLIVFSLIGFVLIVMNGIFIAWKCGCCKDCKVCVSYHGKYAFESVKYDDKFEIEEDQQVEVEQIEETK